MSISTLLGTAEDTNFNLLAEDALYTPDGGDAVAIKAMPMRPDADIEVLSTRVHAETAVFTVRASEVSAPQEGEAMVFDGTNYAIKGNPDYKDNRRRYWILETRPA